jgi:hypothetical protein
MTEYDDSYGYDYDDSPEAMRAAVDMLKKEKRRSSSIQEQADLELSHEKWAEEQNQKKMQGFEEELRCAGISPRQAQEFMQNYPDLAVDYLYEQGKRDARKVLEAMDHLPERRPDVSKNWKEFWRDSSGRLHDSSGKFVSEHQAPRQSQPQQRTQPYQPGTPRQRQQGEPSATQRVRDKAQKGGRITAEDELDLIADFF